MDDRPPLRPRGLRSIALAAVSLALALALGGCGGEDDDVGSPVDLPEDPTAPLGVERGSPSFPEDAAITVAAAPPADAFLRDAAEAFANETDVAVAVRTVGGDQAAASLCGEAGRGRAQIVGIGNRLPDGERARCQQQSIRPAEHRVGYQAVALVANPERQLRCLSLDELRRLWAGGSEVNELSDLEESLPGGHVELLGPPPGRPTHELFVERALAGDDVREYRRVDDAAVLRELIEANPKALAFYGYGRINQAAPGPVALVPIRGDGECVPPTRATIQAGRYPLARPVHVIAGDVSASSPAGRFLRYALSNRRRFALTSDEIVPATG